MNKRHYEHTLPNIRGSLSNTYLFSDVKGLVKRLDRICKFGQPDNEKGREAYFYLE